MLRSDSLSSDSFLMWFSAPAYCEWACVYEAHVLAICPWQKPVAASKRSRQERTETRTSNGSLDSLHCDRTGKSRTDRRGKSCDLQGRKQPKSVASFHLLYRHADLNLDSQNPRETLGTRVQLCTPRPLGEMGGKDKGHP